jgi:FkbM family methyltransferase
MLSTIARLVNAALAPAGLRLSYRIGSDPVADIARLLAGRDVRVVIDGGAYIGDFSSQMSRRFPAARVHAFEPTPDSHAKLQAHVGSIATVTTHRMALGSKAGEARLHLNNSPLTNSLRPNAATNERYFGDLVATQAEVSVAVTRLDEFCAAQGIDRIDILKLDLQGNELDALHGLGDLIRRVGVLLVEVQFVPLYDGAPYFSDIERYLRERGCALYQLYEMARSPADGRLLYADALFVNAELLQPAGLPGRS